MIAFASVLLGALWSFTFCLIGYGLGAKDKNFVGCGVIVVAILTIVTFCFVVGSVVAP